MVFIYFPAKIRYTRPRRCFQRREQVIELAKSSGIPTVDIHSVFTSRYHPLSFIPEREIVHYNARGYKLVADTILSYIRAESRAYSCVLNANADCRWMRAIF